MTLCPRPAQLWTKVVLTAVDDAQLHSQHLHIELCV